MTKKGNYIVILHRKGLLSKDQLQAAQELSKSSGVRVREALVQLGIISQETLDEALAERDRAPTDLSKFDELPEIVSSSFGPIEPSKPVQKATPNVPNYFYYDENGTKFGPVTPQQVQELAKRGAITPETQMETDNGRRGNAGQIRGLQFLPPPLLAASETEIPKGMGLEITLWIAFGVSCLFALLGLFIWLVITVIALLCAAVLLVFAIVERYRNLVRRAEEGDIQAMYQLAYWLQWIKPNDAVQWLTKAAKNGHAQAQLKLGLRFKDGNLAESNPTQAFYLFKKAADQGLADAQYEVGYCYMMGYGVDEDEVKAFNYLRNAAANGSQGAQVFRSLADVRYKKALVRQVEISKCQARIASSHNYTVAVKTDGTVAVAGDESQYHQFELMSRWQNIVAVAAGGLAVGLKKDGTVVIAPSKVADGSVTPRELIEQGRFIMKPLDTSGWRNIVAVAAGTAHVVGLKSNGTLVSEGHDFSGQRRIYDWRNIISIAANGAFTMGLKENGTVVAVGKINEGQCDTAGWQDIIAIAAGDSSAVGLRANGTVVASGKNDKGQCDTACWRNIIAITAGYEHTVGLCADGTVVASGENYLGQCNTVTWQNIVAIAAGAFHTVGLRADGTTIATGDNTKGQCNTHGLRNILNPKQIPTLPLLDIGLLSGTSEIQQNRGRVVPPVATTPSSKTVMSEQEIGNFLAHRSLQIRMLIEAMFLEQGIEVKIEVIDGHFGDNDWLFTPGYVFRCKSRNDEFYLSMRGHISRIKSDNPRDIARWIEGDVGLQTKISNKADIIAYKTGTSQELINQVVNLCNTAVLPAN